MTEGEVIVLEGDDDEDYQVLAEVCERIRLDIESGGGGRRPISLRGIQDEAEIHAKR